MVVTNNDHHESYEKYFGNLFEMKNEQKGFKNYKSYYKQMQT